MPAGDRCEPVAPLPVPARFRPQLGNRPLTQAGSVWRTTSSTGKPRARCRSMPTRRPRWRCAGSMADVLPAIALTGTLERRRRDVAAAPHAARAARGNAAISWSKSTTTAAPRLRFGDDRNGQRPDDRHTRSRRPTASATAAAGNVGARIDRAHRRRRLTASCRVRNPLPAAAASIRNRAESVRRRAPEAFRRQERAVTPEDYAEVTERHDDVAARRRDAALDRQLAHGVRHRRPRGRRSADADVRAIRCSATSTATAWPATTSTSTIRVYVPLELALHVCVKPDYFRSDVKRGLLELLQQPRTARRPPRPVPSGQLQLRPDRLPQPIVRGRARGAGRRVGAGHTRSSARAPRTNWPSRRRAVLALGRLEIARLDNDPNYPEHGVLRPRPARRQIRSGHRCTDMTITRLRLLRRRRDRRRACASIAPGLPAIAYRVGTPRRLQGGAARAPVQRRLSGAGRRCARARRTTISPSPCATAFAVLLDVLTFYQERIANEAYLRTAIERRSVVELARLIGYQLSPGVAASTAPRVHAGGRARHAVAGRAAGDDSGRHARAERPGPGRGAADLRDHRGGDRARRMERDSGADLGAADHSSSAPGAVLAGTATQVQRRRRDR